MSFLYFPVFFTITLVTDNSKKLKTTKLYIYREIFYLIIIVIPCSFICGVTVENKLPQLCYVLYYLFINVVVFHVFHHIIHALYFQSPLFLTLWTYILISCPFKHLIYPNHINLDFCPFFVTYKNFHCSLDIVFLVLSSLVDPHTQHSTHIYITPNFACLQMSCFHALKCCQFHYSPMSISLRCK